MGREAQAAECCEIHVLAWFSREEGNGWRRKPVTATKYAETIYGPGARIKGA